jgi:hypothetical protein
MPMQQTLVMLPKLLCSVHSQRDGLIPDFCFTWPDDDVDITAVHAKKSPKRLKRPSIDQDSNVKRPASKLRTAIAG